MGKVGWISIGRVGKDSIGKFNVDPENISKEDKKIGKKVKVGENWETEKRKRT